MNKETADSESSIKKESKSERLWKISRNWNAISAVAFAGASLVFPGPAILYNTAVAWNAVQAGGSEVLRRQSKKKRLNKQPKRVDQNT